MEQAVTSEQQVQAGVLGSGLRTLVVAGAGKPPEAELRRLIADDELPDAVSPEIAINATYIDDRMIAAIPGLHGRIARRLPYQLAQALEVLVLGRHYDVVVTWSDLPSIVVACALRLRPRAPAQVAILFWPSKPKKALPLRLVQRRMARFIVWPPMQRRFLEDRLGISPERFVDVARPVDTRFWRPLAREPELISSAGQEMRDYATLVEALRPLDIPCHIAAGSSIFGTAAEKWWKESLTAENVPGNITVGPKSFVDLRDLYARSKFIVVPLIPSDMDNGITTITEAFAMGKTVIVTSTPGLGDFLKEGVNCIRVPPHDPTALRAAIVDLWADPEKCARLGAAGRALVTAENGLDRWTTVLVSAVAQAAGAERTG